MFIGYWKVILYCKYKPCIMKIFISHDSRDKKRFVEGFATKLVENGIDVWYDAWELKFGDSLMTIFDAISQCDIFISVISEYSVESKWVKEESDSAFMKKIENNVKFIPVILPGDFEIPNYMEHILQCRIQNLDNYNSEFNKLLSDIYGISTKPKIGNEPRYTTISPIDKLEQSDTIVLKLIGDFNIKHKIYSMSFEKIVELAEDFDLTPEDIKGSLEMLSDLYYVKYRTVISGQFVHIRFTYQGILLYCKNYVNDFELILKKTFSSIINENLRTNDQIIEKTKTERLIINGILECLDSRHYIKMTKTMSGTFIIHRIFEKGKRYMKKILNNEQGPTQSNKIILPECNEKETNIFKDLCNYCLDKHFDDELDPLTILNIAYKYYNEDDFEKLQERVAYSLRNLERNNYLINDGGSIGMAFTSKSISQKGFCFYLKHYLDGKTIYYNVIQSLITDGENKIETIAEKYSINYSIVEAIIKLFRKQGYVVCNNDLTDITVTIDGEEYFEEIISSQN